MIIISFKFAAGKSDSKKLTNGFQAKKKRPLCDRTLYLTAFVKVTKVDETSKIFRHHKE